MEPEEYEFLRHVWFPMARVADLRDGVVGGRVLDTDLVAYQVDGDITVAEAPCPHRGMDLRMGRVVRGSLECPYHGWLFAPGAGHCVHVPSRPPDARPVEATLRTHSVEVAYGLVWTCLGTPFLPRANLPSSIDDLWQLGNGDTYDVRCGMRQLTENFRDRAHLPFVHSEAMGDISKVVEPYSVHKQGHELTYSTSVTRELSGRERGDHTLEYEVDYQLTLPMLASARIRSPDGLQGQRFVAQIVAPIDSQGNQARQFWLVGVDAAAAAIGATIEESLTFERRIFQEDHAIVENQSPREAPLDLDSQKHTAADRLSIAYRRSYRELLSNFHAPNGS